MESCKLDRARADGFHRKEFLKGVRHRSKSCDSPRHFYSDKLHHKDKWKRRNYCSRAARIAAARKCTSHGLLLYPCECFGGRVWYLLEIEYGYHHQAFITQINKDIWTHRRQFKVSPRPRDGLNLLGWISATRSGVKRFLLHTQRIMKPFKRVLWIVPLWIWFFKQQQMENVIRNNKAIVTVRYSLGLVLKNGWERKVWKIGQTKLGQI